MEAERWHRVKEVLAAALERPPHLRSALLDEACVGDQPLRLEVEDLLRAEEAAGAFIEEPVAFAAVVPQESADGDADANLGRTLGPYRLERRIGHGGMGTVYLASRVDQEFERHVAIKMIRRGMDSELIVRRFRHERQILASLDHPHIASLFDGGTTPDGLPYFVMEYVDGAPIDRYADEHRLTTADRLRLCLSVLDAVQHAHDHKVVHRDLKPSNVLVTADGRPKLLDFGIAKILDPKSDAVSTFTSLVWPMTPDYASPEQVRGEPATPATDVYAVGVLVYELLTGHRPYQLTTHTPEELLRVVCQQDPERPSAIIDQTETTQLGDGTTRTTTPATVSSTRDGSPRLLRQRLHGALDEIVLKALRKEADHRYESAAALADDIRRYLADQPVLAGRGLIRYRASRWLRVHRLALGAAAMVVTAAGLSALLAGTFTSRRAAQAGRDTHAAQVASRPSLAVVDFQNLTQKADDQWLSTAMAEMLMTELAGDGQLRVVPGDQVARAERDVPRTDEAALRARLATDLLVVGSYGVAGDPERRSVRIDVRVQRGAGDAIAVASIGDEAQLFSVIADVGRQLRSQLGLRTSSPEATSAARAAFPRSLEATKLYAEGTSHLRRLEAVAARDLFEQAAAREPDNPLVQTALASAWTMLGYDGRAEAAAKKAFDASGALNREDRLAVEGRLYEAQRQPAKAIDVYRTLWGFFADNIEYGLRLASAQTLAGRGRDALATVAAMRRAPAPQDRDPRIDIAEAEADSALGDFPHELTALQGALKRASQSGAKGVEARARLLEGRSYYSQGQPDWAKESMESARQMFVEAGDRAGAASALNSLATVLGDQQDISRAQRMYEESLVASEEIGDRRGMSAALNNLGVLLKDQRQYAAARQAHERALALRREIGDRSWTAVSLSNIGVVLFEQDQFRDAARYYQESLAICREIGDKRGQVRALHNLAIVEREVGHLEPARAAFEESLATRAEIGDKRGVAIGRVELGMVLFAEGELLRAKQSEDEALRLSREARLKPGEAQALYLLGEIALASGDVAEARRDHEQALALRREMKETRTILESEVALGAIALEEGRPEDAERDGIRLAQSLEKEPAGPPHVAVQLLIARARLARHDADAAARALTEAQRIGGRSERVDVQQELTMVKAELDAARGRTREARDQLDRLLTVLARSGMVLAQLQTRLLKLQVDRTEGRASVRADARALEKDAQARRAGLVARHAQALART